MKNLRIDEKNRKEKITLRVNGKEIIAYRGETVLAALIASGYRSLHKNEESRQPRSPLCGMGVCFECRATIDGIPNVRTCMTYASDGMEINIDL